MGRVADLQPSTTVEGRTSWQSLDKTLIHGYECTPHTRQKISPVASVSSPKLWNQKALWAVLSRRRRCRHFLRYRDGYILVPLFITRIMSNKLPPYALKINRPRHLARIPPENLILTTARLDRAKPSPRSLVQPSPGANEFPSNASPTEVKASGDT